MKKRPYFEEFWREFDREKSLVMISGPRQAGKTTLARAIAAKQASALYFNYDIPDDKVRLAEDPLFFQQLDRASDHRPLVILDEIHKYKSWKSYLKGIYDGFSHEYRFLATGSGKLDLYRRQGDALAARYRHFHLFPFTMGELYCEAPSGRPKHPGFDTPLERATSEQQEALDDLLNCSGFPEPFLRGTRTSYNRWASVYHREILRADVRDVSGVRDLDTVEMLYHLLIPRVGSPLSIAQLMGPLKTAHRTIGSWISLFDRLQLTFRLKPFSRRINRSILKEPKLYFIDYARVRNAGKRFENLIAVELKRATLNWTDFGLGNYELWYLRTKDGEEVDFLVTRDGDPWFLVEAKLNEAVPSTALRKFQSQLHVPAVQLVRRRGIQRVLSNGPDRILVCDAASWLPGLG